MCPRGRKDGSTSVNFNFLCGWKISTNGLKGLDGVEKFLAGVHCLFLVLYRGFS